MAATRTDPLVVTLPPEIGARILQMAGAQHRSPEEIVREACLRHFARSDSAALEELYERGYEEFPEDTGDLEALLPYLPLPEESWP